jgi:hypothetical protein
MVVVLTCIGLAVLATNILTLFSIGALMSTQADLVQAVADLDASITGLEQKPDTLTGPSLVDQATLDSTVASLASFKSRVDAETTKK